MIPVYFISFAGNVKTKTAFPAENTQYRCVNLLAWNDFLLDSGEDRGGGALKIRTADKVVPGKYRLDGGIAAAGKLDDGVHKHIVRNNYAFKSQLLPQNAVHLRRQGGGLLWIHAFHYVMAYDSRPYEDFTAGDFLPFEAGILAGADSVLVSHNIVECMDPEQPRQGCPPQRAGNPLQ